MRKTRLSWLAVLGATAVVASACADSSVRSPLAPSAVPVAAQGVGATPDARTRTSVVDPDAIESWARFTGFMTAASGLMVEGSDVISAVSGDCPDRTITVRGVPVMLNSGTTFGPGTSCAALAAGVTVHVRGLLTIENGSYVLLANTISVNGQAGQRPATGPSDDDGSGGSTNEGPGPGRHEAGEGTVASVRGGCPAVSMVIRGYAVSTDAATIYVGGTCGDLRPGVKVAISGTTQANFLLAETVEFTR